jgi:hypothetical protein
VRLTLAAHPFVHQPTGTQCGFTVLDQARAMINACTDPDQLQRWAVRAVTAKTIDEVFA